MKFYVGEYVSTPDGDLIVPADKHVVEYFRSRNAASEHMQEHQAESPRTQFVLVLDPNP